MNKKRLTPKGMQKLSVDAQKKRLGTEAAYKADMKKRIEKRWENRKKLSTA